MDLKLFTSRTVNTDLSFTIGQYSVNKGGHYEINTNGAILNKMGDYDTKIDGIEM